MKLKHILFLALFYAFTVLSLAACTLVTPTPEPVPAEGTPASIDTPTPFEVVTLAPSSVPASPLPSTVPTSSPTLASTPAPTRRPDVSVAATPPPGWFPYALQADMPALMAGFAHPDLSCQWMGVAGQVFSASGEPSTDVVVNITGTLNGKPFTSMSLTGAAKAYGPGGYEIQLSDQPLASAATLFIQLTDLQGKVLSDQIPFNTYQDCQENLILFNFQQQDGFIHTYLPIVSR